MHVRLSRATVLPSGRSAGRARTRIAAVGVLTVASLAAALSTGFVPAQAAPGPVAQAAGTVTDDALPTVQIDGVVWSQAVVGNTVYAGGKFANARPAGSAAGTNQTTRNNLLSYDLTTGALNTAFAPSLNAQVKAVTASPDGSRIYVGGAFTTANGVNRYRIAAYNTSTGALITTFAPTLNATVNAIVATNTTVYLGGVFGTANGNSRLHLAAFSASNGALLNWAPTTDTPVNAMVLTPDGSKIVLGGNFATVNGQTAQGLAAVNSSTGALVPWAANTVVHDYGTQSAILSLSTDGTAIYGTGYVTQSGTGNLEGSFSADPSTGALTWLESCHGDSYGIYPTADSVYVVGHPYDCSSIGGFGNPSPIAGDPYHRAIAFTPKATGTNSGGNFAGVASPSLLNWFPTLAAGTVTGTSQAAWSVTGGSGYVVLGGEFTAVNGVKQQGLVRFTTRAKAPNKVGPQLSGTTFPVTATSTNGGSPVVRWNANWDPDDLNLTYSVVRDGVTSKPVYTSQPVSSTFWNYSGVPLSFTDTTATPGAHTYRVYATDPSGNTAAGPSTGVTVPATVFGASTPKVGAIDGGFPVTLGMKVSSSVAGSLTGVRFWKGNGNTGTHTVSVWSTSGERLATATVTSETASGWQSATFSTPVAVTAGTTYIVSYLCPVKGYAEDDHYFASSVTNGPLTAPAGAGVYSGGDAFPSNTYVNANYWVDPLFTAKA